MTLAIQPQQLIHTLGTGPSLKISSPTQTSTAGFGQALDLALKSVSQAQGEADTFSRAVQLEKDGVSIEQTMIAMQKSSLALTAAVTVRNKMVAAYSEIMSMQV